MVSKDTGWWFWGGGVSGGGGGIGGFRGVWGAEMCVLGLNQGCVKM